MADFPGDSCLTGSEKRPQQYDVFFSGVFEKSLGHQLAISNLAVSSLMLQINNDFDVSVEQGRRHSITSTRKSNAKENSVDIDHSFAQIATSLYFSHIGN